MRDGTPWQPDPQELQPEGLENCDSIILCLSDRRFVVIRTDTPKDLWPINGGWEVLRKLQPGDPVVYKGKRTEVRALDVYRHV